MEWGYLDMVMEKMGFSCESRQQIMEYINTKSISTFVNGIPTEEFKMFRGIQQGDP